MLLQKGNESDKIISNMYTKEFVRTKISKAFVSDQIEKDVASTKKKKMKAGVAYYNEQQKILKAKANVVDIGGQAQTIVGKSNFKPVHNFHTLLVDQKKDYLLGNKVKITFEEGVSEDKQKLILDMLTIEFNENLQQMVVGASNKSEEWAHYFINEKGKFDWVVIPAEQVIPFYDGKYDRKLVTIIRYYNVDVTNVETNKTTQIKRAEVWTPEDVTYYIQTSGNTFELDKDEPVNPRPHVILGDFLEDEERKQLNTDEVFTWEDVPFLPIYNNTAKKTDLQPIKSLIDLYDELIATGANTIIDLQEAIWEVKGYEGDKIEELAQKLKQFKVVNLSAEDRAGIKGHQLDIPWEARKDLIEKTKDSIYEQGRGVNIYSDNFKSDPSGVALKALYYPLDIKCNAMETSIRKFIDSLLLAVEKWLQQTGEDKETVIDKITYKIDRSMLINDAEVADIAQKSKGIISDETIWENHPFVKDTAKEKLRMEEQKANEFGNTDFE